MAAESPVDEDIQEALLFCGVVVADADDARCAASVRKTAAVNSSKRQSQKTEKC